MKKSKIGILTIGIIAVVIVVYALWSWTSYPVVAQGILVLRITDRVNLTEISSLNIVISKIEVHKATREEIITQGTQEIIETNETDTKGWETVVNESKSFDLIQIRGVNEFLGQKVLDAGIYTQIRLEISEGSVVINGTVYDLTIPSKKFKLVKTFTIKSNETTLLIFDFDAAKSIVKAGTKYILKPVIQILDVQAMAD